MTTPEARALGERWIAAGGGLHERMQIRWHGADALSNATVIQPSRNGGLVMVAGRLLRQDTALRDAIGTMLIQSWPAHQLWPDLRDPATRGAMLEVVRERYGLNLAVIWEARGGADGEGEWRVGFIGAGAQLVTVAKGPTEPEALVAALEAAPR